MPNRYAWIALGVGAYLAFALSLLPAAAAYRMVAPEALRLSGIEGTVWSGSAALGSAGGFPLHDVEWNLDAWPLLIGRASGRLSARLSDGFLQSDVTASGNRVVLEDLQSSSSVATLRAFVPLEGVEGLISVSMERLELEDEWPVQAVGVARIAELAAPPLMPTGGSSEPIPLGNYEITFVESDAPGIAATVRDTGGPLAVNGRLTLDPERNYALEGGVAPREDAPQELVQALQFMTGEPGADGMRPFSLTGSL